MKIVVLGAGVQGTLFGVKLSQAGHAVTLVARGRRAAELRDHGARIEHAITRSRIVVNLPVAETLAVDTCADLCLVMVRREQLDAALSQLTSASGIARAVFMVSHANGSSTLFEALGRPRVVLAFPGAGGGLEDGVVRYVEIPEQPTVIEATASDLAAVLRGAGFRVRPVADMDSWLRRHAIFVAAIGGALYAAGGDARRLAADRRRVRKLVLTVRQGWSALDRIGVAPAPLALRTIFCYVPLPFAVMYWCRLLGSPRGEFYFARHTRHAPREMAALASDIRALIANPVPPLLAEALGAIDQAASNEDAPTREGPVGPTSH